MYLTRYIPDKIYLKKKFKKKMGYQLNLKEPKTFNEKLQWLKLYDHKPIYTIMVDKYEAKKYVADIIGEEYIIPTYGVWDRFEDIDFDSLPDRFVLKTTHDSGGVVICRDKSIRNIESARIKLSKSLKNNFYYQGREWPYKNVKPRIIAEEYIEELDSSSVPDYKVHCFNGVPKVILVCKDRFSEQGLTEDFFDVNWNHLDVKRPHLNISSTEIPKPHSLKGMLDLAEKLSKSLPFVRVDYYLINDKIKFGELTFYPASGFEKFEPEAFDDEMGNWLSIKQ